MALFILITIIQLELIFRNFQHLIKESLEIVLENYNPLPELKSIRNGSYHINIANGDLKLLHEIKKLNIKKLQTTYVLK